MSVQINGNVLINARHKRGLSQQDVVGLAKRRGFNVSLFTISKAENGGSINPATAAMFSKVLKIPMDRLVIERAEVYADIPNPATKTATRQLVKSARTHPRRKRA